AEGHADADLARALRYAVGHHAVYTRGREHEGEGGEHGEEDEREAAAAEGVADHALHRLNPIYGLTRGYALHDLAHGRRDGVGVRPRRHNERHVVETSRRLRGGDVELCARVL